MAAMCSLAAAAQSYRSVKIIKTDGSSVVVGGEKDLAARFADGEMSFAVGGKVLLTLPTEEVRGWQLSEESSVAMLGDDSPLHIYFDGEVLTVSGVPYGSRVSLHDLSGIKISETEVRPQDNGSENACRLDVSKLPAGIYLLSCNGKSLKIHIRQ